LDLSQYQNSTWELVEHDFAGGGGQTRFLPKISDGDGEFSLALIMLWLYNSHEKQEKQKYMVMIVEEGSKLRNPVFRHQ
jgi:hypothetical protein